MRRTALGTVLRVVARTGAVQPLGYQRTIDDILAESTRRERYDSSRRGRRAAAAEVRRDYRRDPGVYRLDYEDPPIGCGTFA